MRRALWLAAIAASVAFPPSLHCQQQEPAKPSSQDSTASQSGAMSSTKEISGMIFKDFVYPFELTSFLILVAILGATVLAQREKS